MAVSLNNRDLLEAEIMEPATGAWTARVEVDSGETITSPALMDIDGAVFVGSVRRGAPEADRFIAELIGGNGGLSTELEAKYYDQATLGVILADIMTETGEVLSPETLADVGLLTTRVESWSRAGGRAGNALQQVVDESGADLWRVQRNGLIFVGTDLFLPTSPTFDFIEIDRLPDQGKIIIGPEDSPDVVPGTQFDDTNVSAVVTHVSPGLLRQEILLSDEGDGKFDRLLGPLQRFIEQLVGRRIDYSQTYEAKVVIQKGGRFDILPDDLRVRGNGLTNVPAFHGLPGIKLVIVLPGERVLFTFRNGDPKLPAITGWADGGGGIGTSIQADALFKALGATGPLGSELTTHTHTGVTTGPGVSGPPLPA
jgi:hypothetical protein